MTTKTETYKITMTLKTLMQLFGKQKITMKKTSKKEQWKERSNHQNKNCVFVTSCLSIY